MKAGSESCTLILLVPGSDRPGRTWQLSGETIIGRTPSNEVCVRDATVGRRQVHIGDERGDGTRLLRDLHSTSGVRACGPEGIWQDCWDADFELVDNSLINPGGLLFLYRRAPFDAPEISALLCALQEREWLTGALRRQRLLRRLAEGRCAKQAIAVQIEEIDPSSHHHLDESVVVACLLRARSVLPRTMEFGLTACGFVALGDHSTRQIDHLEQALALPLRLSDEGSMATLRFRVQRHLDSPSLARALTETVAQRPLFAQEVLLDADASRCSSCEGELFAMDGLAGQGVGCAVCGGMFDLQLAHAWRTSNPDITPWI